MDNPLRVLVVDDTVTYRRIVTDALNGLPDIEVVGSASNGKIALEKIQQLQPDMLTLDVEMPEMDGLELLRRMSSAPSGPSAIMISSLTTEGARATVEALSLGAFDFVVKPSGSGMQASSDMLRQDLRQKLSAFGRSRQIRRILRGLPAGDSRPPCGPAPRCSASAPGTTAARPNSSPLPTVKPTVIALGISTGGPQALTRLLPQLPADLAAPLVIVQHMPPVFTRSLAEDLNRRSALQVCEASDGQSIAAGNVYIAPGGKQMKLDATSGTPLVRITDDPPENSCRPAVDYLFRSVAEIFGPRALGVIMTGMGNDGSRGMRQMHAKGAALLAQDQATCVVYGMPREPIEQGIATAIPLDAMAAEIVRRVGKGRTPCR